MILGYHGSISGGIVKAIDHLHSNGCNAIQVFIHNPQSAKIKIITDDECANIKQSLIKKSMTMVIHSPYILNLAKLNPHSVSMLQSELIYAHKMGAIGTVIHMGKTTDMDKVECDNNFKTQVLSIAQFIKDNNLSSKLILETPAGQGTEMYTAVDDFVRMFLSFKNMQRYLGLCLDTCHMWASDSMILDKYVPLLPYIRVIHLNDAKGTRGCRKDRHEDIGKGSIGWDNLRVWVQFAKENRIPIILETPAEDHTEELTLCKSIS